MILFNNYKFTQSIFTFRRTFFYILTASVLFFSAIGCSHKKPEVPYYLNDLDSLMERGTEFENEKILRIEDLRIRLHHAKSPTERFSLNSMLFDEFSTYASDSALKYIDANIEIAGNEKNIEWLNQSYIKKSDLFTATGMLPQAAALLDSVDRASLKGFMLTDYFGQLIYLYSHMGNYIGAPDNEYYKKERDYKDSIMQHITEDHPEYLWYKGLDILGTDKPAEETVEELNVAMAGSRLNTPIDAKNAYILGKLYEQIGDHENYKKFMALSSSADIRFSNRRELSSLEELARILYDEKHGDIVRAFKYVNYCLNRAITYPNRTKINGISWALDQINNEYQNRMNEQQEAEHRTLITICILAAILAFAIVINIILYIRVHRQKVNLHDNNISLNEYINELHSSQKLLNEANSKLIQLNADLKQKNYELDEANYVKEEYICSIFTICSNYIGKITDLKKSVHVNLLAKKYREIERETEDFDTRSELKEFYNSFDSIFLHIYPDFVNDFNSLLQEDKRIYPKEGELLNTELRIYALIRLGITDSVKIAEFLHCSPQTVYNNRFKVRNKAAIPKENFAEAVRKLGRYVDSGA